MPRVAREKSPTDYYHIMMRGINKEKIFIDSAFKEFIEELLGAQLKENQVCIIAYCIMDNHLHLVVKGELEDISFALKKVNIRFAMRLNRELKRVGHVFQDRFKSEVIHNDQHLLQAIRYVHNNPVQAKTVSTPEEYRWSSYSCYISKNTGILDNNFIEEILAIAGGLQYFIAFHKTKDFFEFLDTKEEIENNGQELAQSIIEEYCKKNKVKEIGSRERHSGHLTEIIKLLLNKTKLSHRQIANILEIDKNIVHSISRNGKNI